MPCLYYILLNQESCQPLPFSAVSMVEPLHGVRELIQNGLTLQEGVDYACLEVEHCFHSGSRTYIGIKSRITQ